MLLTLAVPCYNAAAHMHRCLDSLLAVQASMEIIIINDGSTDNTGAVADAYARSFPDYVRVVHQQNGGHGAGVMAGLALAKGLFFKVVDSDDWLDTDALRAILTRLAALAGEKPPDLVVCNYTRHHQGKVRMIRYSRAFPRDHTFTWQGAGVLKAHQHLMMHALIFRTALLRQCDLQLPRHTYYVDILITHIPLLYAKTMHYCDVSLYQYLTGQAQQSVNVHNVIRNIDHMLRVTDILIDAYLSRQSALEAAQRQMLLSGISLTTGIASVHLMMSGEADANDTLHRFWEGIRRKDAGLYAQIRGTPVGFLAGTRSPFGHWVSRCIYRIVDSLFHIN